jgi:outer membrane protein assembly factor BamB
MRLTYGIVLAWGCMALSAAQADNWPQWRGPNFDGSSNEKDLPCQWSKTENIAWTADLPGNAAATPVVWENRVFLSGADAARDMLQAMCFDRTSGKLLWKHDVAKGIRRDTGSTYASASPATDGRRVFFLYGNGHLVGYSVAGDRLWTRNIEKDYGPLAFYWTYGSSPLLYDGRLYVQVLQCNVPEEGRGLKDRENQSYLLALDPETGRTLWRHVRPSEAVLESRESYTTPVPVVHDGQPQLLVMGGDAISGHDPATGRELWRWGQWNPARAPHWPQIASPLTGGGVALVCVPKLQPVYAIRLGGAGTLDERAVAWTSRALKTVSTEVPTPAFYHGDFFVLSDSRKSLSCLAADSGQLKWTITTPGQAKYEASPLAADGRLYLINSQGQVALVDAANGKLLRVIPMEELTRDEPVRASIIAAHGQLLIRTTRKLYCVGRGR